MSSRTLRMLIAVLVISVLPGHAGATPSVAPTLVVTPVQFSPDGDGNRDNTTVAVTITQPAYLQVRILDSNGHAVRYLANYEQLEPGGTYNYKWNGRNSGGAVQPEGRYFAEATAKLAPAGPPVGSARATTIINDTIARASAASTPLAYNRYPSLFSPNGDGRKDGLVARFYLSRPASVTMRMLVAGREIQSVTGSWSTSGAKTLQWNGKDSTGQWAPAGQYTIQLDALPTDSATASRLGHAQATVGMTADKSAPAVTASLSSSVIYTSARDSTRLAYSSTEAGYAQALVKDASGQVVYSTGWAATSGSGSFTWSGRGSSGSVVPSGAYAMYVYVQDRAGNAASQYPIVKKITVDSRNPLTATATKRPWSGWWWPMLNTYSTKLYNNPGPMTLYDRYAAATGRPVGAYDWEYNNHRTADPANVWWGHCQAWAAAAIMEPQPYAATKAGVYFSQDTAEGLYSETWTNHVGRFYGTRYSGGGTSSAAYQDIYPADFDRVVLYWIGKMKVPLMMDFDPGIRVWNYPVYAFKRTSRQVGDNQYVTMTLTRAAPYYGYSGTAPLYRTFYYTLRDGTNGVWSNPDGSSVDTHPDYVLEVVGRADDYGNPYVKPSVLDEIFRGSAASTPRSTAPTASSTPNVDIPNDMGWRVGTQWTVRVREYATYLAQPTWITTEYRYRVVSEDVTTGTFTLSMGFADPSGQPLSVRGDLLLAGYRVQEGRLTLAWLQPAGSSSQLPPSEAGSLLGQNFVSMGIPSDPFDGTPVFVVVPGLGQVQGSQLNLSADETATFVKGVPWWASYTKGSYIKAQLTSFTR